MPEDNKGKSRTVRGPEAKPKTAPAATKRAQKTSSKPAGTPSEPAKTTNQTPSKPQEKAPRRPPSIFKPRKFKEMAKTFGVDENPLFLATLETYRIQLSVIQSIQEALQNASMTVEKSYVQGVSNEYIHPAAKELPRHMDSANKTAAQLVSIIKGLGTTPVGGVGDEFENF